MADSIFPVPQESLLDVVREQSVLTDSLTGRLCPYLSKRFRQTVQVLLTALAVDHGFLVAKSAINTGSPAHSEQCSFP